MQSRMATYFRIEQAEALLKEVEEAVRQAIQLKQFYVEAEAILRQETQRILVSGGALVDVGRLQAERSRRDTCARKLNEAIERIHSFGCELKDLDLGLIDFRTLYQGREVYLCWKLGEPKIEYWHGLEEGFRGRKKIDEKFLKEHRGSLPM
ncbi:MAG: DUF2203 domain-containing protein [Bryobacteraceae bacterium]|nr:DUF2203 domain-containing protein [Bryobacteraceae bacterium]MDW8379673.1 DUF2203 domain-containing protein [Bryobacterales bacterium]